MLYRDEVTGCPYLEARHVSVHSDHLQPYEFSKEFNNIKLTRQIRNVTN